MVADKGPEDEWRIDLQSTLTALATHLRRCPPSDRPVAVDIANSKVDVTPAEREIVVRVAASGGEGVPRHLRLVCDGLVLRAKLLEDTFELEAATETARPEAAARLRRDVEVGYRLLHAVQGEMSVLMATGRAENGRRLAEHRSLLTEALQRVQRSLGEAGEDRIQPTVATAGASAETREAQGLDRRSGTRPMSRLVPHLVAGLLFALLAVLLVRLWANRVGDLPQMSVGDFTAVPGVEQVVSRPPTVILVIAADRWSKLDRETRARAVEKASLMVEHHGYRRVQFRSASGTVLAEWSKGGKVTVRD